MTDPIIIPEETIVTLGDKQFREVYQADGTTQYYPVESAPPPVYIPPRYEYIPEAPTPIPPPDPLQITVTKIPNTSYPINSGGTNIAQEGSPGGWGGEQTTRDVLPGSTSGLPTRPNEWEKNVSYGGVSVGMYSGLSVYDSALLEYNSGRLSAQDFNKFIDAYQSSMGPQQAGGINPYTGQMATQEEIQAALAKYQDSAPVSEVSPYAAPIDLAPQALAPSKNYISTAISGTTYSGVPIDSVPLTAVGDYTHKITQSLGEPAFLSQNIASALSAQAALQQQSGQLGMIPNLSPTYIKDFSDASRSALTSMGLESLGTGIVPITADMSPAQRFTTMAENFDPAFRNIFGGASSVLSSGISQLPTGETGQSILQGGNSFIAGGASSIFQAGAIPSQIAGHYWDKGALTERDYTSAMSFGMGLIVPKIFRGANYVANKAGTSLQERALTWGSSKIGRAFQSTAVYAGAMIKHIPTFFGGALAYDYAVGLPDAYSLNPGNSFYDRAYKNVNKYGQRQQTSTPFWISYDKYNPLSFAKKETGGASPIGPYNTPETGGMAPLLSSRAPSNREVFTRVSEMSTTELVPMGLGASLEARTAPGIDKMLSDESGQVRLTAPASKDRYVTQLMEQRVSDFVKENYEGKTVREVRPEDLVYKPLDLSVPEARDVYPYGRSSPLYDTLSTPGEELVEIPSNARRLKGDFTEPTITIDPLEPFNEYPYGRSSPLLDRLVTPGEELVETPFNALPKDLTSSIEPRSSYAGLEPINEYPYGQFSKLSDRLDRLVTPGEELVETPINALLKDIPEPIEQNVLRPDLEPFDVYPYGRSSPIVNDYVETPYESFVEIPGSRLSQVLEKPKSFTEMMQTDYPNHPSYPEGRFSILVDNLRTAGEDLIEIPKANIPVETIGAVDSRALSSEQLRAKAIFDEMKSDPVSGFSDLTIDYTPKQSWSARQVELETKPSKDMGNGLYQVLEDPVVKQVLEDPILKQESILQESNQVYDKYDRVVPVSHIRTVQESDFIFDNVSIQDIAPSYDPVYDRAQIYGTDLMRIQDSEYVQDQTYVHEYVPGQDLIQNPVYGVPQKSIYDYPQVLEYPQVPEQVTPQIPVYENPQVPDFPQIPEYVTSQVPELPQVPKVPYPPEYPPSPQVPFFPTVPREITGLLTTEKRKKKPEVVRKKKRKTKENDILKPWYPAALENVNYDEMMHKGKRAWHVGDQPTSVAMFGRQVRGGFGSTIPTVRQFIHQVKGTPDKLNSQFGNKITTGKLFKGKRLKL